MACDPCPHLLRIAELESEVAALVSHLRQVPRLFGLSVWSFEMDSVHEKANGDEIHAIMQGTHVILERYPVPEEAP